METFKKMAKFRYFSFVVRTSQIRTRRQTAMELPVCAVRFAVYNPWHGHGA